jgi:organic hydroperoxide reductase OsmC/OhrA
MRAIHSTCFALALPLVLAACGSSAPRYVKQEVSAEDAQTAMSECEYQIRLNKTPKAEQDELRNLCMQGKGYRAGK